MGEKSNPPHFWILQVAASAIFLGRAWQHLRWDGPYRTLLWDEGLMRGLVEGLFGTTWSDYVTDPAVDQAIQAGTQTVGAFLLLCGLVVWTIPRWTRLASWIIGLGSVWLIFLSWLYFKEHFNQAGLFIEYALQWGTPLLLLMAVSRTQWTRTWRLGAALAAALTFIGHGLYAIGWYPRPGYFVQMTLNITGWSEANSIRFLAWAGALDFLAALALFVPLVRVRMVGAAYMVFWGAATAIARLWAHWIPGMAWEVLAQWLHQVIYRLPHALVPLILFLVWYRDWRDPAHPDDRLPEKERYY